MCISSFHMIHAFQMGTNLLIVIVTEIGETLRCISVSLNGINLNSWGWFNPFAAGPYYIRFFTFFFSTIYIGF